MDETDDLISALYVALDPTVTRENWFKLIERTVDKALAPYIEKVEPTKR